MDVGRARTIRVLSLCALITAGVVVFDVLTPLGVAAPLPYIVVVLVTLQLYRATLSFLAAAVCTILAILGYWMSENYGAEGTAMINRGLVIGVLWITALLSVHMASLDVSRRRLATIVDSTDDAVIGKTLDGIITDWNRGAERLYGYTAEDAVGRSISLIIPPERAAEGTDILNRIRRGERVAELETTRVTKGNGRIAVAMTISPMRDATGRIVGASAIARDISQRTQAEELLRLAAESSPSGMFIVNSAGRIVFANTEAERQFAYTRGEMIGQPIEMLVPQRFRERHPVDRAEFLAAPTTRAMGAGRELFGRRKDGSEFPVEIGLNPIAMRGELMVLSAVVDISERRRAEEEQRRAAAELARKNEELEQFVYTVSHDLKTPLVTLQGFASHLRKDVSQARLDRLDDFAQRIEAAVDRMQAIIHDLLAINRVGRVVDEPEEVDVGQIVRQWLSENQTLVAGVSVEVQHALPVILFDRQRFWEIIDNLLTNAVKYGCTHPEPKLCLGSEESCDELLFFVEDNGPGIPEKYRERVFDLFQRLQTDQDGTGVGLALVKRVVEHAGGRVWTEDSRAGQGARFLVALPKRVLAQARLDTKT